MDQFEIVQVGNESVTYSITDMLGQADSQGALACLFEVGNYGDISIINAFTGKRLCVNASFEPTVNFYEALRRAIAVAEKVHFLGDPPN